MYYFILVDSQACTYKCVDIYRGLTECESYVFVLQIPTPPEAAPQLPTEGINARQLSTGILPCSWTQLWGTRTTAEIQRCLGGDRGWRGYPRGLGEARRPCGGGWRGGKARGRPGRARWRRGDGWAVTRGWGVGCRRGTGGGQV